MSLGTTAAGRLEIQSGLGRRTYQLTDLSAARLVPMAPQIPLATISGFGDLLPLAAELAGQVGAFGSNRNLFYADEKGGRFVFSDEHLEWGTRYRLLALHEIAPPLELGLALSWKPEGRFGEWQSYEITLPSAFLSSKPDLPTEIAEFLGHHIRSARPRLYLADPLPHHVEIGGTYVYPEPPESLLLRKHGSGETAVTASVGTVETGILELGNEWVQVRGRWADGCEYAIAVDGNEQVIFRVEACELYRPPGVTVVTDDLAWDLCADPPLDASALAARTVNIDCTSARIAALLARLNDGWVLEETRLSLPSGSAKELYAESFGELRGVVPISQRESENGGTAYSAAQQTRAVVVGFWIERLVLREHGAGAATHVRRYLSNPSAENLNRLGPILTSRLMPYIRAAQHHTSERMEGDENI